MVYHKIVKINLLPILYKDQDSILLCYKTKGAFTHWQGFKFCPGCGSNVSRLCRKISVKKFMKKVLDVYGPKKK